MRNVPHNDRSRQGNTSILLSTVALTGKLNEEILQALYTYDSVGLPIQEVVAALVDTLGSVLNEVMMLDQRFLDICQDEEEDEECIRCATCGLTQPLGADCTACGNVVA